MSLLYFLAILNAVSFASVPELQKYTLAIPLELIIFSPEHNNGNKYIDFTSGYGVSSLGYSNSNLKNALKEQVDKFYGLTSKDDQYVSYKETQRLMNSLNGHTRVVEDGGHFLEEEGFVTFTSLINRMQGYMTRSDVYTSILVCTFKH